MSTLDVTVGELLLKTSEGAKAVLEHPALGEVRARVALKATVAWPAVSQTFADALHSALDVKVLDILGGGWTKLVQLQDYLDRERYPPEGRYLVPLARHTISSVHHPGVEILLNEQVIEKVVFDLEFVLSLEGFVLDVRDARITAIGAGTYAGGGVLRFSSVTLCDVQTPKFQLPGRVELGEGIAIPRFW